MIAAGGGHALYDVLVIAHVISALIGFGSLAVSGVYGFSGRRPGGPASLDEARRYFASPGRLELLVLAVPVLGIVALAVEPGGRGVGQQWALLALVVWGVSAVTLVVVVRPAEARLRSVLGAPEPDRSALAEPAGRLAWGSVVTDVGFVVALMLMLFQPR